MRPTLNAASHCICTGSEPAHTTASQRAAEAWALAYRAALARQGTCDEHQHDAARGLTEEQIGQINFFFIACERPCCRLEPCIHRLRLAVTQGDGRVGSAVFSLCCLQIFRTSSMRRPSRVSGIGTTSTLCILCTRHSLRMHATLDL